MVLTVKVNDLVIGLVSGEYAGRKRSAELAVSVALETKAGEFQTTDHRTVTEVTRLSVSAGVWNSRHSDFTMCGQIRDALDNMVSYAPGWDAAKVRRLGEIWGAWHLNDMKAACEHQNTPRGGLGGSAPCPVTGYEWGSSWLVAELPAEVAAEVTRMFTPGILAG